MSTHHHHNKVVTKTGLNVGHHQAHEIPHMKNETVIIPSTSNPSFGSYFIFDMKEKGCYLHNLSIQFQVGPLTVTNPVNIPANYPHFNPAVFWYTRIELVINSQVIDTYYPTQQFVHQQLFNDEPTRRFINNSMGAYDSIAQRYYLSSRYSNYNVELVDLFKHAHLPLLHPKDDVQLRVYMDTLQNCALIAPAGSSGSSGILSCGAIKANLLAKVSRLQHQHTQLLHKHHLRPNHYKFLETRFGTFNINAGTGSTTIVLTPIVGLVSYLFFTVRYATGSGIENDNEYTFLPITQFAILDNTSTNIVGGQAISGDYALSFLNKDWCKSSYTAETQYGVVNNNAYVYMYSFSADPVESATTGVGFNAHRFIGNEQLQLTFPVSATNLQVDLYAMCEAVLESTQTYVKKISL